MTYNNKTFRVSHGVSKKLIISIIACIFGIVSLFLLLTPGLAYTSAISSKVTYFSLGEVIWGGSVFSVNPGLIVAFFLVIAASLIVLATSSFHYIGFLAGILFLTAAVLYFCAIPLSSSALELLSSKGQASLAYGTITSGVLLIISSIFSFIASWGD